MAGSLIPCQQKPSCPQLPCGSAQVRWSFTRHKISNSMPYGWRSTSFFDLSCKASEISYAQTGTTFFSCCPYVFGLRATIFQSSCNSQPCSVHNCGAWRCRAYLRANSLFSTIGDVVSYGLKIRTRVTQHRVQAHAPPCSRHRRGSGLAACAAARRSARSLRLNSV